MFEMFYWSNIIEAASKLPKEAIVGVAAAYVILDIHKRNTQVKIEEAKAKTRTAELELEALKLKVKLQQQFGPDAA